MKTTDMLGCAGWAAFLLLSSFWIPVVGPLISLFTPLPFLYYSTKLGFHQGLMVAVVAALALGLVARLAGYPQIILFGLELGVLGLILSELFRRKLSLGQIIFYATGLMLLLGTGFLYFVAFSKGQGPFEMVLGYLQRNLELTFKVYEEMGLPQEEARELESYGKVFMDLVSRIYPSLMMVGTGVAVWLNVVMAKPLFQIGKLKYPEFDPLDRWQAPETLVWLVIVSGFALFLLSGDIRFIAINTLVITMVVYLFQGISIVLFFFNKYRVPSWVRGGVYFLIIVQQLFLIILSLAGLFDQWMDFRKIRKKHPGQ